LAFCLRRRTNIAAAPAPNRISTGGSGTCVPLLVLVVPQCFHLQWPPDEVEVLPVLDELLLVELEVDELELVDDEPEVLLPDEVELLPDDELLLEPELLPDELPVDPQCFLQ
jgi:hypothetical protein